MTSLFLTLLSFNLSAKVRETDLKVTGAFENFDESILKMKNGTVSLFDSSNCGFFKCHWRNFVLKNQEDRTDISLNKEGIKSYYNYYVGQFGSEEITGDFSTFSLTSSDNQLKLNFAYLSKYK